MHSPRLTKDEIAVVVAALKSYPKHVDTGWWVYKKPPPGLGIEEELEWYHKYGCPAVQLALFRENKVDMDLFQKALKHIWHFLEFRERGDYLAAVYHDPAEVASHLESRK